MDRLISCILRGEHTWGSRHPLLQVALQSALEIDVSTCVSAELEAGSDLHLHGVDDDNLPLAIACWKACLHVEVP